MAQRYVGIAARRPPSDTRNSGHALRSGLAVVAILLMLGGGPAAAGTDPPGATRETPPVGRDLEAEAARTELRPVLDGNVLDDPAWADAPVISGFWQTTPNEGAPATEHTEVRVIYTDDTLYIGVVAYDRNPEQIVVADARRDSSLNETDSFRIVFDTYRDGQNGFLFGTNPAGIEYDAQVVNESINVNWDGAWQVRARISEIGWSAEFAIPFRTLRYPRQEVQTWGLNFQRNIRRRNETSFWAPLSRQYSIQRLSLAGRLTGVEVRAQRNLQLTPYVLGSTRQDGMRPSGSTSFGDVGADVKYGITPSLTLDVTYNTDFAQVEVDEQQVNLDRFNLFFPEKRPFFLENSGLFNVGIGSEVRVFMSRSIGIGPGGQTIPILGGARLSGRVGHTSIGLITMQTDEVASVSQANNFAVARVSHELPNRSAIGAMFVNRQSTGRLATSDDHNRSYALDGRWGIGRNGQLSGFFAQTATPGVQDAQYAYHLNSGYSSQAWNLSLNYSEVADNFNPEVGFLRRGGFRKVDGNARYTIRPAAFGNFHELRPHMSFNSYWDFDGFNESAYGHFDQHWELKAGHEFHTGMNLTREGVKTPFRIFPGVVVPPGTYDHAETQLVFFTNRGAPFSVHTQLIAGGFFGGTRVQLTPSLRFRFGETLNGELRLARNDITLPGGAFVTNLIRSRVSYSFTPNVFIQSLLQYNDRANLWSSNLRFGWHQRGGSGVFVVYNNVQGLADSTMLRPDHSLVIKVSRLIDVLD
jgi:hypothetical protein